MIVNEKSEEVYTGSELLDRVESSDIVFIFVYMNKCGHCVDFKPTFDKLNKRFGKHADFVMINGPMAPRSIREILNFKGFPSLYISSKGEIDSYDGDRTFDDIRGNLSETYRAQKGYLRRSPLLVKNDPSKIKRLRTSPRRHVRR